MRLMLIVVVGALILLFSVFYFLFQDHLYLVFFAYILKYLVVEIKKTFAVKLLQKQQYYR